jgi:CRISPR associated protein Cas1
MYALLESEARLAGALLGLDPGIGFLHVDTDARDSLACDLMEPARPHVDAFLLDWIREQPLRREWFFEQRDGSCRLMASFVVRLSETLPAWRQILAPIAEWVSRMLWSNVRRPGRRTLPATHLTQSHRRHAKGKPHPHVVSLPRPPRLCQTCGRNITPASRYCPSCAVAVSTEELVKGAQRARDASHSPGAQASRAEKGRRNTAARWAWLPSSQPAGLNEQSYREKIHPRLAGVPVRVLASALAVSLPYASNIRSGKRQPHPRHWQTLSRLVGTTQQTVKKT